MDILDCGEDKAVITGKCRVTGELYTTQPVAKTAIEAWASGKPIQVAMPELSAEDREFIISGFSPKGWKQLFPDEE